VSVRGAAIGSWAGESYPMNGSAFVTMSCTGMVFEWDCGNSAAVEALKGALVSPDVSPKSLPAK